MKLNSFRYESSFGAWLKRIVINKCINAINKKKVELVFPKFPVHISIPVLIGAGGIAYATNYNPYDWDESHYFIEDATGYFVLEPGIELELNIVRFFRLAIGGYYRYTSNIRLYDTPENVLHGFSGGITMKFGKF